MEHQGDRAPHAGYVHRKTDEEFNTSCEGRDHIADSLDGPPALPLPPPQPAGQPAPPTGHAIHARRAPTP
ncbi:hypothetical protein ACFV5J_07670 [Streptomyces zaomyceticus]|uniref:hypothetical protein n=1 Tax=Streptomyces zaomyceticus TaxID=68286 RepID=UPI003665C69E